MAKVDITTVLAGRSGFNTAAISSNTTTNGIIIDTAGYEGLNFYIMSGTITDGSYAINVQDGDNSGLSDAATVAAADLVNALPSFVATDDNVVKEIGYIGPKRYVRLQIVSTGVTTGGTFSVLAVQGAPLIAPVA